jgi:hypothetical protein
MAKRPPTQAHTERTPTSYRGAGPEVIRRRPPPMARPALDFADKVRANAADREGRAYRAELEEQASDWIATLKALLSDVDGQLSTRRAELDRVYQTATQQEIREAEGDYYEWRGRAKRYRQGLHRRYLQGRGRGGSTSTASCQYRWQAQWDHAAGEALEVEAPDGWEVASEARGAWTPIGNDASHGVLWRRLLVEVSAG